MKRRARGKSRPARPASTGQTPFSLHGSAPPSERENRVLGRLAVALAAVLAVVLLAIVFGPHVVGDYFTETDFYGAYAEGARLVQGGTLDPSRYGVIGPGYEVALAIVGFVVHDLFRAAQLLSVVSAVSALLLWFAVLRGLIGARVALIAGLFIVTNTDFIRYGHSATTDAFGMALQAVVVWLLLTRRGRWAMLGAGAVAALAFLTRYNSVYLLPAGLIVILAGATHAAKRMRGALQFAAGFAAPVVPWVLYSLSKGASAGLQLHHNIAYEVFARPKDIVWDDYQRLMQPEFASLWDVIAKDPGAVAARMLHNLYDHLHLDAQVLLGWPVAIAAALGLLLLLSGGAWKRAWPLAAFGGLLFLTLVPVFHSARYSLGLLPLYAALAGAFFGLPLLALAVGRNRRVWLKPLLAAVPLVLVLQVNAAAHKDAMRILPREVLHVAERLKELKGPGDRIIARKGHVPYYAGVEVLAFPFADSLSQLAEYAHDKNARWLYASWPEVWTRPRFWYLLDTTAAVPGLRVRAYTEDHPAVLYEIDERFGEMPAWYANDTLRSLHTANAQLLVNPSNAQALYTYAQIQHQRGRLDLAQPALVQLIGLDPENFGALLLLGDTALRRGDLEMALAAFQRAQERRPESIAARVGMGWVYAEAGNDPQAAATWRPVIASVTDPVTLLRMVDLFRSQGDPDAARLAMETLRSRQGG